MYPLLAIPLRALCKLLAILRTYLRRSLVAVVITSGFMPPFVELIFLRRRPTARAG